MKIVIVEDEAPIREGLQKVITKINSRYEVLGTASNGIDGLELILEKKPDLIIMDIRMSKMDGLTMLEHARAKGVDCKAVILSAFSDFSYAKQAINLGIEGYLLKPLHVPELAALLENVEKKIRTEESKYLSMETILMQGLTGQLEITEELKKELVYRFNIYLEQPAYLFVTYLGDAYEKHQDEIINAVQEMRVQSSSVFNCHIMKVAGHKEILTLIYNVEDLKTLHRNIEKNVIPTLLKLVPTQIFAWKEVPNLEKMHLFMNQLDDKLDWNLIFGQGVLISVDKIEELKTIPAIYPKDLENQAKQALIHRQQARFREYVEEFCKRFQKNLHRPKDIKEAGIRFCMAMLSVAQKYGYQVELLNQTVMQSITKATSWREISHGMNDLFDNIMACHQENMETKNPLIQRAMEVIREEYQNGLTLEELADKLYVSDEYLSAQFKRETGKTFTETIRKIRLEKVKDLLLHSNLKLNQIAYMVGISDPRYMSKVFREEYGVLPAEYRKMHSRI